MPRRKYKKYVRRKRRAPKRRSRKVSPTYPLSNKFLFKTRYVEVDKVIDVGIGGVAQTMVYRLTSLFDPNFSGAGHQPIGFDQIMPMYDHYCVIGARVRVSATNLDRDPQHIIMQIRDTATVGTNISQILENGATKHVIVNGEGNNNTKTLGLNFSAKKFFGKSPMDGDKYQGTLTNNPNENAFLHLIVQPIEADNPGKIVYTITIEFIALLTEPKQLGQS